MNYTINYPGGQPHLSTVPVAQGGQRTIVLTTPGQSPAMSVNSSMNNQQSYPVVMQVGGTNTPQMFYTYQNNENIVSSPSNSNENINGGSTGVSQVVLSPVSSLQTGVSVHGNSGSPTLPSVSVRPDHKGGAARNLGFNLQTVNSLQNTAQIVQSGTLPSRVPVNTTSNSEFGNILSSLQAAGIQLVESPCGTNTKSAITIPVMNTHLQSSEFPDKTLAISLPNSSLEEGSPCVEPVYNFVETAHPVNVQAVTGEYIRTTDTATYVFHCRYHKCMFTFVQTKTT